MTIEATQSGNQQGREALAKWRDAIAENCFEYDLDYQHSIDFYLKNHRLKKALSSFGAKVTSELESLVIENNLAQNLPRLDEYDSIGRMSRNIVHHPSYMMAGDIIYSSRLLERMSKPGGLLNCLAFFFLSSQAGEAGHNCPIACSAGIIRIFQKTNDFPNKAFYLKKLITPSYQENFTGAQFLTEIQGGSDVGANATIAYKDKDRNWRIKGEKWFCSNANADLILITARFDNNIVGTKGLGLFLVPAKLENGENNAYRIRRLKDKLGTRSMASAEIDFLDAVAIPMGPVEDGIKMVLENVLHFSRLFNSISTLGMARRAFFIAKKYCEHREAFGRKIINYPLVQANLAKIYAENSALLASIFSTVKCQDEFDCSKRKTNKNKLLLRTLANLNKYITALWTVEHIHHSIDMLAGNGTIESFSVLPRLFRDSIVTENWEGTHYTLYMQILRDMHKYQVDMILLTHLQEKSKTFKADDQRAKKLNNAIDILTQKIQRFKKQPQNIQALAIKPVVDDIAKLYAATMLLYEANHQSKTTKRETKLACFDYFYALHLAESKPKVDDDYLRLIQTILMQA